MDNNLKPRKKRRGIDESEDSLGLFTTSFEEFLPLTSS